jgi:hypothetical protein
MPLSFMLMLGLLNTSAHPCAILPRADVHVVAAPSEISLDTNFSLDQIAGLAREGGQSNDRPPFGFYVGTFQDTVGVTLTTSSGTRCADRILIEVRMQIANRHIAIGRELEQNPCLFSLALRHYKRKADADEAAIVRYANALAATLSAMTLPSGAIESQDAFYAAGELRIEELVTSLIEKSIEPLHTARIASQQAVDTIEEMTRFAECSRQPGLP